VQGRVLLTIVDGRPVFDLTRAKRGA